MTAFDITISDIGSFKRARMGAPESAFEAETEKEFLAREKQNEGSARQKCWIAAQFVSEDRYSDIDFESEDVLKAFYVCINELWLVRFHYRTPHEQVLLSGELCAARVDWLKLKRDTFCSIPYANVIGTGTKALIRDKQRSLEQLSSIRRVIGFFDHDGKRYFLDPEERTLKTRDGGTLCGFL